MIVYTYIHTQNSLTFEWIFNSYIPRYNNNDDDHEDRNAYFSIIKSIECHNIDTDRSIFDIPETIT